MDVRMPDGTLVRNVPEGMTKAQLVAKLRINADPSEYDPSSPEYQAKYGPMTAGTEQRPIRGVGMVDAPISSPFIEKVGSGLTAGARSMSRLGGDIFNAIPLLPNVDIPKKLSNEAFQAQEEIDKPLLESGKGFGGRVLGEVAASFPIGGVASAPFKAILPKATGRIAGALTGRTAQAGSEGAAQSVAMAAPEDRGKAAGVGLLLGGGLSKAAQAAGRTIRGLVKKSEETEELQQIAGQHGEEIFAPLSQAAGDKGFLTKTIAAMYREALPFIPGVGERFTSQMRKGLEKVRQIAGKEAEEVPGTIPFDAGKDPELFARAAGKALDKAYGETISSYSFNVPSDFRVQVTNKIKKELPNVDQTTLNKAATELDQIMARFSDNGTVIHGSNLANAKTAAAALIRSLRRVDRKAAIAGTKVFDDIVESELKIGGKSQNLADLQRYQQLGETWKNYVAFGKAVGTAPKESGKFTAAQLARVSKNAPTQKLIGAKGHQVLGEPIKGASTLSRGVSLGSGALALWAFPQVAIPVLAGAHGLASKTVQKAFLGDLLAQKTVAEFLERNPEMYEQLSRVVRTAAITEVGD